MVLFRWPSALILLAISICIAVNGELELDREAIRRSILSFRQKRSLQHENVHDLTSRSRVRRQTTFFPNDDEDFADFGSGFSPDEEPLPPDVLEPEPPLVATVKQAVISEWVWYRCSVNFLDSIEYSVDLQDYTTEAFHAISEKIMFAMEAYLGRTLEGYHEATPLMFSKNEDYVEVLVDVGTCTTTTASEIENAIRALLRSGQIDDLAVSEEGFSMREVGRDPSRQECLPANQIAPTTPPAPPTERAQENNEPDFDVVKPETTTASRADLRPSRRPYRCSENQATCRNGQCIDRKLICDGNRNCADGSDEPPSCGNADSTKCDPTEFLCIGTGVCAQKLWRCDGDDDCGNGYDELNCPTASPGSACRGIEFECAIDSLCVPASYQCDGEDDCSDSSDELGCVAPIVITPPQKLIKAQLGQTVEMECEAVGTPSPIVSWRLNWGNVGAPPRVSMTSSGGIGKLTIRDARPSDQGAYTCEAINSEGSIFAIPDAVLVLEDAEDSDECPPGHFGSKSDICRPCYCFGVTDQCEPSRREYDEIGITFNSEEDLGVVELKPAEVEGADPTPASEPINRNQILVKPAARELQLIDLSKRFLAAAHYWSLPAQFLGAKINSYGGTLTFSFSYNNSYNFEPKPTNHSDVILEGANGQTLVYHDKGKHPEPVVKNTQNVVLSENDWATPEGEPATRTDMLNVLNNVDKVLLRTVYDNSMLSTGIGDIRLTAANPRFAATGSSTGIPATAVEECICPPGYTGLSCQYCAPGYDRITVGPFVGKCELAEQAEPPARQCDPGYTGIDCRQCAEGYEAAGNTCEPLPPNDECDSAGSYGVSVGGECDCKPGCEGELCDRCKPGYFYLSEENADGCLSCFCMGVSRQCTSTDQFRSEITPSYGQGERFLLTNAASSRTAQGEIGSGFGQPVVQASLGDMPRDVYFWTLPNKFTGNQISSYGGRFRYTIAYDQRSDAIPITRIADVRITGNGITLEHKSGLQPEPRNLNDYAVYLKEDYWVRPDDTPATREHLMMALADVQSFVIRATYSNAMETSMISGISLESAAEGDTGARRALEVESCVCPTGYTGLSCEDCSTGYRRSGSGLYLGTCVKCSCNGHSVSCDEVTGSCIECRHNTEGENCDRCIPGFFGDPTLGTAGDCQPCPCPILPSRSDRTVIATCIVDLDGLPTCDGCPPGYEGRLCNSCARGFESDIQVPGSPCRKVGSACQCDPNGSLDGTCDADGQCDCKESVEGLKCDACKPSYFYFSVENMDGGCLPCFCMGVTRDCASSTYVRDKISADFNDDYGGFSLTDRQRSQFIDSGMTVRARGRVLTRPRMNELPTENYYWRLPDHFLGDKIVSYGGELQYSVSYTPFASGASVTDHDVIIIGNDIMLVASIDGDVSARDEVERSVVFKEKNWRRADGNVATREHLLMALADLEEILIRATYSSSMSETTISNVSMEVSSANEFDGAYIAYEVEHCTCPDGYEGLSCEDCSPGYTRSGGGMYLGLCHPCQCNGLADFCDPETGVCVDCRENTIGDNCEECAPGFYTMSSEPSEIYCQQCACPGVGDNSFSEACEYVRETRNLLCTACQEGYEGSRCENCAEGYEGNPRISGGQCTRKEESGGIIQAAPVITVSPSSINLAEGDSATISCLVQSTPPVRVMWRRAGATSERGIPEKARETDDHTLTIPNFSRDDAGTYECVAQNQGGVDTDSSIVTIAEKRTMIEVHVAPPTSRRLRTGDQVTFVCTATSNMPGYILYWSKEGGRLPRGRSTDFSGILRISDLTEEDSGTYTCTGSNMYEIDRMSATLTVVGDFAGVGPSISIQPARQVVREGQQAVFRCSADGTQPINIEWRPSAGEKMPESAKVIGGELHIPAVDMHHAGVYYCRASNPQKTAEATAVLDVTAIGYPPRVTVLTRSPVSKTEGSNVELRCIASGLPRPLFSWRRVGKSVLSANAESRGGILLLMDTKVENRDTYVCTARNTFGEDSGYIRVNITSAKKVEKPICKTDPESLTAYLGAEASITCVAKGDPPPTVTWVRADGMGLHSNTEVVGNKLLIHNVTTFNAGKYICIATNEGGTTKSQMTLEVEDKKLPQVEILPQKQQVVEVGHSASFTCRPVSGHPVEVTWSRTDRKPFTDRTKLEGGVITFTDVRAEDGGSYICIARNVVGYREVATLLSVIRKPTLSIEPSTDVYLREGSSVTLRCNADGIPAPNVAWKKVALFGRLISLTHYRRHSNELRITNAGADDAAQYKCVAASIAGDADKIVTVTVGRRDAIAKPEVTVERNVISATFGSRVQMRCAATGNPEPDMFWSRKSGSLPSGATQSEGVLTIPRVNQRDTGTYVCKAGNLGGFDTAETTLKIIVAPRLQLTPPGPIIRIESSGSVVITCSATEGTSPITYEFRKVSGTMSSNILASGGRMQVLAYSQEIDSGRYICVGRNAAGTSSKEFTMLPMVVPTVSVRPPEVTATMGDLVKVECVSDDKEATLTWIRADDTPMDSTRISQANGFLRIEHVTAADEGGYECKATNKAGSSSQITTITIRGPPKAKMSSSLVEGELIHVGDKIEMICTGTGHPKPQITITKDGTELLTSEEGRLVLDPVLSSDSGRYACVSTNVAGSDNDVIVIDVQAPRSLSIIPDTKLLEARSGEELAISCVVTGSDIPVVWSKQGDQLPSTTAVEGNVLQIDKIAVNDAGTYVCTALIGRKTIEKSISVTVHAFIPYFTQSPTSYISLRSNADFFRSLRITVSFRPNSGDGMLLYSYGSGGDFLSLTLLDHKVEFRFSVGSGPAVIVSSERVEMSKWHTVTISRQGREGELVLDGGTPVRGTSEGSFRDLDLNQPLYIGGYPVRGETLPPSLRFLGSDLGFYGCISQLKIAGETVDFGSSPAVNEMVGVVRCKTCGLDDDDNPCQHKASCLETHSVKKGYICGCPQEYVGPECQFRKEDICGDIDSCGSHGSCIPDYDRELGYRCDCEPGFTGPKCEHEAQEHDFSIILPLFDEIEGEEVTSEPQPPVDSQPVPITPRIVTKLDVEPTGDGVDDTPAEVTGNDGILQGSAIPFEEDDTAMSFEKNSHMQLDVSHTNRRQFDVTMRIKLRSLDDGLILYNSGVLGGRKRAADGTEIFVSIAILDGILEFRYDCGSGLAVLKSAGPKLTIGEWHTIHANRANRKGIMEVDSVVVAEGQSPRGGRSADLNGPLFIGGVREWDQVPEKVGVSVGFEGCIQQVVIDGRLSGLRTPVGAQNVEECYDVVTTIPATDPATTQDAKTTAGTTTDDKQVEKEDEYLSSLFLHSGRPATNLSSTSSRFGGESFISFPEERFRHDSVAEQFSLYFRSTDPDGLILLHGMANSQPAGGDFIMFGLRNARLQYSFQIGTSQGKAMGSFPVADGQWHRVTVVRRATLAFMWMDDLSHPVAVHAQGEPTSGIRLGDVFIGGATDVPMYTGERFKRGFRGCIRDIRFRSLNQEEAMQIGATYLDDSDVAPLLFDERQGRNGAKGVSKCRMDKKRDLGFP